MTGDYDSGDVLAVGPFREKNIWILDSSYTFHMCPELDWFHNIKSYDGGKVYMGDDSTYKITGIGNIKLKMSDGMVRTLRDVRYIPGLRRNLISLGQLDQYGLSYKAEGGTLKISRGSLVLLKAVIRDGLYELIWEISMAKGGSVLVAEDKNKATLWHGRLGHMSEKGLQILSKQGLLNGDKINNLDFCEHCIRGKQHRLSFQLGSHKSKAILEYIHADLWGPEKIATQGGNSYFLSLVDDYSRKVWTFLLKKKSDAYDKFRS